MTGSEAALADAVPWLAVVTPVHNGAEYLEATLNSLVAEGCHGVCIIIIDSSDDDRCTRIVARFQDKLSIEYSYRPDVKPWPAKTNLAVQSAPAPFVCMLHQDDVWLPGRLALIREAVHSCPEAAMYLSPAYIIDSKGRRLGLWRCPLAEKKIWRRGEALERLLVQNFIAIPAPVISRESWLAVGGMDESLWYTADWDLYLKLACHGSLSYDPTPQTAFRIHGNSLTVKGSRNSDDFQQQMEVVVQRYTHLVDKDRRVTILKLCTLSVEINTALAAGAWGEWKKILDVFKKYLFRNPEVIREYITYSRIIERLFPRILSRTLNFIEKLFFRKGAKHPRNSV
ncbi:glycosyltransferase [Rhizorhapis suberifaciens]|uniref:Glycosyltransferase involved in cell wall biosynthesis n=1 Tax=Rhizorhapis suberifaciens TaxID=13656 RepID=A0A840HQ45_9SPHN|nr:glycosyltransferase [Rhizorhapis suberifaciens]MBB4639747.1 glycosyltransferase involved in cell wall biosynthesis [Rhizorhapis suberifaciens]